eukprot:756589-Hanusia_phi.AAC.2
MDDQTISLVNLVDLLLFSDRNFSGTHTEAPLIPGTKANGSGSMEFKYDIYDSTGGPEMTSNLGPGIRWGRRSDGRVRRGRRCRSSRSRSRRQGRTGRGRSLAGKGGFRRKHDPRESVRVKGIGAAWLWKMRNRAQGQQYVAFCSGFGADSSHCEGHVDTQRRFWRKMPAPGKFDKYILSSCPADMTSVVQADTELDPFLSPISRRQFAMAQHGISWLKHQLQAAVESMQKPDAARQLVTLSPTMPGKVKEEEEECGRGEGEEETGGESGREVEQSKWQCDRSHTGRQSLRDRSMRGAGVSQGGGGGVGRRSEHVERKRKGGSVKEEAGEVQRRDQRKIGETQRRGDSWSHGYR